jgi:hypothetical protein
VARRRGSGTAQHGGSTRGEEESVVARCDEQRRMGCERGEGRFAALLHGGEDKGAEESAHGAMATGSVRWPPSHQAWCHGRVLTSGPQLHFEFSRFSIFQTLKSKIGTFPLSKIHQILHRDSWKHKEQLSFLAQLQMPSRFQVTISGTNSNLNLP